MGEEVEICGAWGGCTLPKGHNRGKADIPANHHIEMGSTGELANLAYKLYEKLQLDIDLDRIYAAETLREKRGSLGLLPRDSFEDGIVNLADAIYRAAIEWRLRNRL